MNSTTLQQRLEAELRRLHATEITIEPEPQAESSGILVKVELGHKSCLLEAEGFLQMLKELPDNVGAEMVKSAIQDSALRGLEWATR